jgi:hypothetical protein
MSSLVNAYGDLIKGSEVMRTLVAAYKLASSEPLRYAIEQTLRQAIKARLDGLFVDDSR